MNKPGEERELEKELFVNIEAPIELRRHLLECSKSIIFVLKNYQKLSLIREEKTKLLAMLKVQVNEINLLCNKLPNYIPRYSLAIERPKLSKKKDKKAGKEVKNQRKPKENISEIDQLQSELNKIEEKLNSLK